ncbi:MAG: hypothetical protein RSE00_01130 [Clostridia bacterium]
MNKSGITMISIVIYVALFFSFTVAAIALSMNMNYKTLSEKGNAWVSEQYEKLQYNIVKSAKASTSIDNINGKIVFSNNDEYEYIKNKKQILKNGGLLVSDVTSVNILEATSLKGKPEKFDYDIQKTKDYVCLEVQFKKYGKEKTAQIFVTAGDGINE